MFWRSASSCMEIMHRDSRINPFPCLRGKEGMGACLERSGKIRPLTRGHVNDEIGRLRGGCDTSAVPIT
jgi:hypothetical protein